MHSSRELGTAGDYTVHLHKKLEPLKEDWYRLQREQFCTIYQHYDWVRIAVATLNKHNELFIVTLMHNQSAEIEVIIPMVLENGIVKRLTWAGSSHAPNNAPVFSANFIHSGNSEILPDILKLIGKAISGLGITMLGNQPLYLNGMDNPMLKLKHKKAVNPLFVMDLNGGIDAVLEAGNAKRKRKTFRRQQRVAEELGGFELVVPTSKEDIITAIDEFRSFKKIRFKKMGIANVFDDADTIAFLEKLGLEPAQKDHQLFKIIQLKVGGITRALYAGGVTKGYFQASVNAISFDDFTTHSPGEFLLYLMVEHLAEAGFTRLDLGIGSERYKHSWCQHEYDMFDTIVPLSRAAMPVVAAMEAKNSVKGFMRSTPLIWQNIKRFRQFTGQFKK